MPGNLSLEQLKAEAAAGTIDTVITAIIDMQGRLMGKRFHVSNFIETAHEGTHGCNYLLATDLEMNTVQGYASASWGMGYGDYMHRPDMATLRRIPWMPGTAMVLCDVMDHHGHEEIAVSPRAVLKRQIARAEAMGFTPMMATELEFYLFRDSYDAHAARGWHDLQPMAPYNIDYSILGTMRDEPVMRAIRNGLYGAGVPVECSKGEADAGQEEVNIRYSDALDTADNHVLVKQAVKEIGFQHGVSASFMAKYRHGKAGSSSHVHQSLMKDGGNAFHDPAAPSGMSDLMRAYLAGLLEHAAESTVFLAPYVNSYKRFCVGLFAPTKAVWSTDNRTAGYRVCGEDTKAVRVECRVGGADLNPYLALAAQLAAGLDGIERGLELGPQHGGDLYADEAAPEIPKTLRDAAELLDRSAFLRGAMGDEVVDHYVHNARWEVEQFDRVVTDWELAHGFERA
ncbi:glutamine synthetase [Paracoccus sp. S-4012]|uniref:glutamine synthetase family protein n=1 Tax=Paracoccus sp. S-4012 TaxID=2665648 RepID=UPI0012B11AF4|nr:glutamine synthetase family protein [Paracoccus sp. S-4012]MRX49959.1 glutamine synthetase [Paracoccus sp. S-4012]